MGLTGTLKKMSELDCLQCGKPYYKSNNRREKHSVKEFMKCLHQANYKLINLGMQQKLERGEIKIKEEEKLNEENNN